MPKNRQGKPELFRKPPGSTFFILTRSRDPIVPFVGGMIRSECGLLYSTFADSRSRRYNGHNRPARFGSEDTDEYIHSGQYQQGFC
jgi:hypothetical protein